MKRKILAMTTALTLAVPAFAQSDAAQVARDALEQYGYDTSMVEMLTASQITEIYLSTTSDDPFAVRQTLRGLNLPEADASAEVAAVEMTPDVRDVAVDALEANGYSAGAIALLTNAEVAELYLAASSGDATAAVETIRGFNLPEGEMDMNAEWTVMAPSSGNIERVVTSRLMSEGYSSAEISTLTQAERAELYIAFTSDDPNQVQVAIDSAFES